VQRNFERRKLSFGTCARAFNTPCIHEHACIKPSPDAVKGVRLAEQTGQISGDGFTSTPE
jgi:hypothetical protein